MILFGLIYYAAHDQTNLAMIKGWPVLIMVVDRLWGTVLSVGGSAIGYAVVRLLR
ncbi:MAG: DUF2177 family protein [Anaerolineae bacterium]